MTRKTLPTLGELSTFDYSGAIGKGTRIWFGKDKKNTAFVAQEDYEILLTHFCGKTIKVGNSRRHRPPGSLGAWLKANVTGAVIAAYVAKILIEEGYATKAEGPVIQIRPKQINAKGVAR